MATMSLAEFNKSSAKVGRFRVKVCLGRVETYEYEKKSTKETITAFKFECVLVGDDPTDYIAAFVKGTKKQVDDAKEKFKDATVWQLSKTALDTWTTPAWISTPKPFRVNLASSTLTLATLAEASKMPSEPVPPRTVAETVCITSTKMQDLIAVVKEVKKRRQNKSGMVILDAILIDGSKAETDEMATLFVSFWGEDKANKVEGSVGQPLAFFSLTVKAESGGRLINHYEQALVRDAPPCDKTTKLRSEAVDLTATQDTCQLSTEKIFTAQTRDVSGPQVLCCAAFLDFTSQEPSADMPSVVQVPWLMIEEPACTEPVKDKQESRLWFIAKARDASGSVQLGCPQRVALALTQAGDMTEFEEKHRTDALGFPLLVHARISRTMRPGSSQTGGSTPTEAPREFVSHVLEEFVPVTWSKAEAPNASFENLLAILNNLPHHEECLQFAFLKDLHPDPHYGFKIIYDGVAAVNAAYAVVLVESTRKTDTTPCGDGFKVETAGVRDIAAIGVGVDTKQLAGVSSDAAYTVLGYSSMNGVVKLDPPRGKKSRFAVLIIDRVNGTTVEMQKAEYVEENDAPGAVECFRRLRALCKKIAPSVELKRTHVLSDTFTESPVNMKKCKTLKAVPTDCSLDGAA